LRRIIGAVNECLGVHALVEEIVKTLVAARYALVNIRVGRVAAIDCIRGEGRGARDEGRRGDGERGRRGDGS
jgi:hypothetical protein